MPLAFERCDQGDSPEVCTRVRDAEIETWEGDLLQLDAPMKFPHGRATASDKQSLEV